MRIAGFSGKGDFHHKNKDKWNEIIDVALFGYLSKESKKNALHPQLQTKLKKTETL